MGVRRWSVIVFAGLFGFGALPAVAQWKAGAAKVNITPKELMWMSGYGARDKPAEGKLTDLWAKALAIEDAAGARAVLITLDLVGIDRELSSAVRDELAKTQRLERRQIAINCSHTHTGPVVGSNLQPMYFLSDVQWKQVTDYTAQLRRDIVAAANQAFDNLAPADLSWAIGTSDFAVNRRANKEADVPALRAAGNLAGPVDHDVPVLSVRDAKGKLRAVAFGYACHATVLSFYQWSGDYPAFAQIELEKAHPDCVALFWAGCGGDQNPLPRRTVELAETYGKRLAKSVEVVLADKANAKPIAGKLATAYDEVELSLAAVPSREQLERDAKSTNRYEASRANYLLKLLARDGSIRPTYPYPVQTWRLGDVTWVTLGGEVVVDYSLRLKRELGDKSTWVTGYTNDVMAYIPSRRVLTEGGYEGAGAMLYYGLPSAWAPDVEEKIIAAARKQAAVLKE